MARTLKTASTTLGFLLLLGIAPIASAQHAEPVAAEQPSIQESRAKALGVVNRYVEAIGGAERVAEQRSSRITGTVKMMGMEGTMEVLMIPDGPFIQRMLIPSIGLESTSGSDGTQGWTFNTMTGAELMPEGMHEQLKRESNPASVLRYDETYKTIEYVGEGDFKGNAVETIRVVDEEGFESIQHFSLETGLMIGSESDQDSPQGKMRVLSVISAYKDFDGLKLATHTAVTAGPVAMEISILDVVMGDIAPEDVAPPKAVAKLLARAAKKKAQEEAKKNEASDD